MGYVGRFSSVIASVFLDNIVELVQKYVFLNPKGGVQSVIIPSYVLFDQPIETAFTMNEFESIPIPSILR